jgi:hypothetical protein
MSHSGWDYPNFDENNISPEIPQAVILVHGKKDVISEQMAIDNRKPLYQWDRNDDKDPSRVRDGGIVFTYIEDSHEFGVRDEIRQDITGEHGIPALQSLLGQGDRDDKSKEKLRSQIQPFGIAVNGDKNNESGRFNIQVGGTKTVANRGPKIIYANSWVYAEFPDVNAPYINGENIKELIFKTYEPSIHKNTPKGIRKCLDDSSDYNTNSGYNRRFVEHCEGMFDSMLDMFLFNAFALKSKGTFKFDDSGKGEPGKKKLMESIEDLGNTYDLLFQGADKYNLTPEGKMTYMMGQINEIKRQLKADGSREEMIKMFFPTPDDVFDENSEFHNFHHGLMPGFLIKQASLLDYQNRWIIGKALTTADVGKDFVLRIIN